jgi:hypothetical protein
MTNDHDDRDERVLKALLAKASRPALPDGIEDRLMRRIGADPAGNVVAFPSRRKPLALWLGLPLAASLAAGIFLGSQKSFDQLMQGFDSASGLDVELPTGLEDQDDDSMDDLT